MGIRVCLGGNGVVYYVQFKGVKVKLRCDLWYFIMESLEEIGWKLNWVFVDDFLQVGQLVE